MKEQELYKGWNFIENKWEDVTKEVYDTLLDPARCIVALPIVCQDCGHKTFEETHLSNIKFSPTQEVKGEKEGWISINDRPINMPYGLYWVYVDGKVILSVFRKAYFYYPSDNLVLGNITHYQPCNTPPPPQTINEQ